MSDENSSRNSAMVKLSLLLPPVCFILLTLFIVGPASIYSGNIAEFEISLLEIVYHSPIYVLILLSVICGISLFLPRSIFYMLVSVLFMLGICLWLQGNIFVWKYALKGEIDWSKDFYRGIIDGFAWVALILSGIIFRRHIIKKTTSIGIIFIVLQLSYLVFMSIQQPDIWAEKKIRDKLVAPQGLFEFSEKQNVIHVVLDELQSTIFREIVDADKPYYYSALDGFTFFEETLGCFPTTVMSIPAFLSGKMYDNSIPIPEFLQTTYQGKTITNVAYDHGFEVDFAVLSQGWYGSGRSTNYYYIPVPYGTSKKTHTAQNVAVMQQLVLFRYAPHFLKKHTQTIFNNMEKMAYQEGRHFAHRDFLQDLIQNATVEREKPVYKLFHFTTTHNPAVLNSLCEPVGGKLPFVWENIKIQSKCSFDHFLLLLEKLKRLGVYDAATIVVHADHGYYHVANSVEQMRIENLSSSQTGNVAIDDEAFSQIVASSLPTLLIKPPFSRGNMQISSVQSSLKDLPDTISGLLNFDTSFGGTSVFELVPGQVRNRAFNYAQIEHQGKKYFKLIDTYEINGKARDRDSWQFTGTVPSPVQLYTPIIDIGTKDDQKFLGAGWARSSGKTRKHGVTYRWALGKAASVFISLPKAEKIQISATMKANAYNGKHQIITVRLDGKKIGSWQLLSNWQWESHTVDIEHDKERPVVSIIELVFSHHQEPDQKDKRPLAVLFDSISVNTIQNSP